MQIFNTKKDGTPIFPNDVISITGQPQNESNTPAPNTGNATHTNSDDTIAKVVDNTGDGLTLTIQAVAAGTTTVTMSGQKHDGTAYSTSFQVTVTATPVNDPSHFFFVEN